MTDHLIAPAVDPQAFDADRWLQAQAALDWPSVSLPELREWNPALVTIARLIAVSSTPMALLLGPRGILLANDAAHTLFYETLGADGAVNGRSVHDVLPDSSSFYAHALARAHAGEAPGFSRQPIRLTANGQPQTRWFNLDFTPAPSVDGNLPAVLGIASDVTPLMHEIRQLADSEQRLHLALESSGMVGLWTMDLPSRMTTADSNVARMYGLPKATTTIGVEDRRFIDAIHPDDRAATREAFSHAIASGTDYRNRYRILGEDGRLRWVVTSATPARDENGKIVRFLGVVVEITDQMQVANALAESRFQFQTLTEALPQIVWSCDVEGVHDYFSARWSEFTGIELDDVTPETWKQLVYPEHQEMVQRAWHQARGTGEPYDIDYRFRHHSGEYRWLRVMALPVRDDQGRINRWFGTSTDIHDGYLLAEERERLTRELHRMATEDVLTGVLTRRAFFDRASALLRPDARGPVSLLMLDVDHFKRINDTHGHATGDKVLAACARQMLVGIRDVDIVGRLGGEEFAILLPRCTHDKAREVAERIRSRIEHTPFPGTDGQPWKVTASIGVTTTSDDAATLEQLLANADKALYLSKRSGRNRVQSAPPFPD